jgi:hypothetical protein
MQHRFLYFSFGLYFLLSLQAQAQQSTASDIAKKPVRSSLGENNIAVGANSFTGALTLDVPLYDAKFRDFTIPVSLTYTGGQGIKPDVIPGSYGNGWDLQFGGYITKIVNGLDVSIRAGNTPLPQVPPTDDPNWSGQAVMDEHYKRMDLFYSTNGSEDVYSFNFLGHSGTFFTDYDGSVKVQSNGGESFEIVKGQNRTHVSASIFPLEDQQFSGQGEYSSPYNRQGQSIAVFLDGFTLKDKKGITYTFGKNDNSIEFTRVAYKGLDYDAAIAMGKNIIPRKWMLTKIAFPNGEEINYMYTRGKLYTTYDIACRGLLYASGSTSLVYPSGYGIQITGTLTNPVYPDRIVLPNQSTISFSWSSGNNQLPFNALSVPNRAYAPNQAFLQPSWKNTSLDANQFALYFGRYFDVGSTAIVNRFPDKLDRIAITDATGSKYRSIQFNYTNTTDTRLKLMSVELYDKTDNRVFNYVFGYNTTSLPPYLSLQDDHLGYYNGKDNMPPTQPVDWLTTKNYYQNRAHEMFTSKEPDLSFAMAEMLNKVTLPNGAQVHLDYENNTYSKIATHWPFQLQVNSSSTVTAGLRLKSTTYSVDGVLTGKKGYYYTRDGAPLATGLSSGICSYTPIYQNDYTGLLSNQDANLRAANTTYWSNKNVVYTAWNSRSMNPLGSLNGPPVTYSSVTEKEEGSGSGNNGYTRTIYTNYDVSLTDDLADIPVDNPVLYHKIDNAAQSQIWKTTPENDRGLERGLVAAQEVYKSDGTPLQKTRNFYNTDPTRFNDHVRHASVDPTEFFAAEVDYFWSVRYTASLYYTFYPYLKKTTVTQRDANGTDMSTTTEFTYDTYRNVKSMTTVNSRNQVMEKILEYPADKAANSPVYTAMVNAHIVDALLTERTVRDGSLHKETITDYVHPSGNLFVPSRRTSQIGSGQPFVEKKFNSYDAKGNLLESETAGGIRQSYLWGYNSLYPVAIASGVSYSNASSVVNPTQLQSPGSDNDIHTLLNNLRNQYPQAQIESYGYDAMGNMKSGMDGAQRKIFYTYDAFGRLSLYVTKTGTYFRNMATSMPTTR